ncbi:MAG: excinuclease ABC subunit C [Gammaproteobacteria bacterium]|nr:excinuclease ABC subunit C [Gammaproteobacteria bacterium]|tara:strand:+ start:30240 stop:32021 length:1782 start_codon:yes stop_codon:yes gene_type:complete
MSINLKKLPNTPGVYKFFYNHEIIYIGKAKDLKKRVSSYFGKSFKDRKTSQIKFLTDKIETFTTKNEVEALLLEQMLIKENKPKFNILLRDDKTYPYIYFSLDHEYPGIYLKRTKKAVDSKYFGPFVSSEAVKKSIKEIQKIFKIRNCSDNTFSNRTRPCIEFQMKRCSAPCVNKIKKTDYFEDISSSKSFLSSSDTKTVLHLETKIEKAVSLLEFEKAAEIRDRLKRINLLKEEQSVVSAAYDVDIFSVHYELSYIGISIIVVRRGKIRGTKTHLIKQAHFQNLEEVYQSVIVNFYENQADIPQKILLKNALENNKLLEDMFCEKYQKKVKIINSPNKSIRPIFNLCKLNAKQVIKNHISKKDKYSFALKELEGYLGSNEINKVEGYDVSHISGDNAVASCVVFSKNGPKKKDYRLFNIPKEISGNDVGSLQHVIKRRLKYYGDSKVKPDLILIDGGKTQLNYVDKIIGKSNYKDINIISIVKGLDRVRATETIIEKNGTVELDKHSKAFLLLQEIRDESHRFALQALRRKKRGKITKSKLDNIKGIGSARKAKLIRRFKSIKNIKSATKEQIMTVDGINEKIASSIKDNIK